MSKPSASATGTVCGVAGVVGMLPFYGTLAWWDVVTHLVAGVALGVFFSTWGGPKRVFLLVLGCSVTWEVAERLAQHHVPGVELVVGTGDTVVDLIMNFVGATVGLLVVYRTAVKDRVAMLVVRTVVRLGLVKRIG